MKLLTGLIALGGVGLNAGDGIWNNSRTGNQAWASPGNWVDENIAEGEGAIATLNAASAATININWGGVDRALGEIRVVGVTGTTNGFSISGSGILTLDQGDESMPILDISGDASSGLSMGSNVTLAGSHGFEKRGSGRLYLTAVSLSGEILLSGGTLATTQALGAASPLVFNGAGATWQASGSSPYTNDVILRGSDGLISGASSEVVLSGRILQDPEVDTARNVTYVNSAGGAANLKRFVVTGDNDYQGTTTIGGSTASITIVQVQHNHALGENNSAVVITGPAGNDQNTLELAGGVVISGKALTLNGRGYEVRGSLRSVSGDNEWAGEIDLGTTNNARIGVDSGRLVISGEISGNTSGGLIVVGNGVLELRSANSYTTGTNMIGGILHVNHNEALGTGGVELRNETALYIGEDIEAQLSSLSFISNNSGLAFDLGGEADSSLWVSGDQSGVNNYVVDIYNADHLVAGEYVLMTVQGTWNAAGLPSEIIPVVFPRPWTGVGEFCPCK